LFLREPERCFERPEECQLYSYVANAPTRWVDRDGTTISENSSVSEIRAEVQKLINEARRLGFNVAANNLQNYLSRGGNLELPVDWLRSFDKVTSAERRNHQYFERQIGQKLGESKAVLIKFTDFWDASITYSDRVLAWDELFYASGDSHIRSTGSFSIYKNPEKLIIEGKVKHKWTDKYDWHPGLQTFIPGAGIVPDAAIKRLENDGAARRFNMSANWETELKAEENRCLFFSILRFNWTYNGILITK
jgi:hypothetical protein